MGIYEREALEAHLASYEEGYEAGFKAGAERAFHEVGDPRGRYLPRTKGGPYTRASYTENVSRRKARAITPYVKAYSIAYKKLKKKHPRMAFGSLAKRAHAAARKKVK